MENYTHCYICNHDFNSYKGLASHLKQKHSDITIKEYYDKFYKQPGEGICPVCGKKTAFIGRLNRGYSKHCSSKCHHSDPEVIKQKKLTTLKKFGDENYRNTEKTKQTKLDRYGSETYNNAAAQSITKSSLTNEQILASVEKSRNTRNKSYNGWVSEESKVKIKQTKLKRYNDETYNNRPAAEITTFEKYGVKHNMQVAEISQAAVNSRYIHFNGNYMSETALNNIREKYKQKIIQKYRDDDNYIINDYNIENQTLECICKKCYKQFNITIQQAYLRKFRYHTVLCTECNSLYGKNRSGEEQELADFIKSIYFGQIELNNRTVLNGRELDIYLPEKKLAFEFDGLYWHNELNKPNNYHVNKTNDCEKAGVQLIHIFEDEWLFKNEIVKSRIKGLLGLNKRIYARKCEVREVLPKDAVMFLNTNHAQGAVNSKYKYGLYYNNELVSLMTFGKSRFSEEFELHRYCNKLNTNVIGGAGKLFSKFISDHSDITKIISFADRRWSIGNLYEKLGFKFVDKTQPSYYYVIDGIRHNRIEFQKYKLIKEGYDSNMTEHEIMLSRDIFRIYDCGNLKYEYNKTEA